jgi:hypothetical protein
MFNLQQMEMQTMTTESKNGLSNREAAALMEGFIIEAENAAKRERARVFGQLVEMSKLDLIGNASPKLIGWFETHSNGLNRACGWKSVTKLSFLSRLMIKIGVWAFNR